MNKLILIPLLLTLLNADLPIPNSKYIHHDVILTNAQEFKDMVVVYCTTSMGRVISCNALKNNTLLSKYEFEQAPYLFAMKKSTFKKYDKIGFFNKESYQKALYTLIKNLKSPIGVSWYEYISNENVTSKTKNSYNYFKITNIKNGYMHFELLKERQELSKSHDWVWAGDTGKGAIALKKDGSFWQFGKVEFDWGVIIPIFEKKYSYPLKGKKIADGFKDAKIIYGGYTLYAIKKDGTLWVWKRGSYNRFIQLTSTHDWLTAGSRYEGNGCNAYEIGLKQDGSIWDLYDINKIKRIGTEKDFTKVAFGCARIYAQKRDGTIFSSYWKDDKSISLKKFIKNKKGADVYEKQGLLDLAHLKSGVLGNHMNTVQRGKLSSEIEIRKDGTLWLTPYL